MSLGIAGLRQTSCKNQPLVRAEKVCGKNRLLQCSGTVFTLPLGRAEKVFGNLLANIAVTICSGTVFTLEELKR
jgi:hypothetical protein